MKRDGRNNFPVHPEIISNISYLYQRGYSSKRIALRFGLHITTVQKHLKRLGQLKRLKTHKCNREFFSSYNEESAYWAGFIMADGCLRSERNVLGIHLQQRDIKHLILFLKAIHSNSKIIQSKGSVSIQISELKIKNDLIENFNIVPVKSKIASFPNKLPKKFYSSFIRGVLDGDGCITISTVPGLSFVGSRALLVRINDILSSELTFQMYSAKTKAGICVPHKGKGWYVSFTYYTKNAKKILDWLYKSSTYDTRLERKYEKYKDLFCQCEGGLG